MSFEAIRARITMNGLSGTGTAAGAAAGPAEEADADAGGCEGVRADDTAEETASSGRVSADGSNELIEPRVPAAMPFTWLTTPPPWEEEPASLPLELMLTDELRLRGAEEREEREALAPAVDAASLVLARRASAAAEESADVALLVLEGAVLASAPAGLVVVAAAAAASSFSLSFSSLFSLSSLILFSIAAISAS